MILKFVTPIFLRVICCYKSIEQAKKKNTIVVVVVVVVVVVIINS